MKVKRTLALLLVLAMIFTIVGCTKVSKDEKKTTTTTAESTTKKNKSEKETTTETQTTQPTSQTTTTTKAKTTKAATVKNQSVIKSEIPTTSESTTAPSTTEPTTPKSPPITITDTSGQVITIDKPLNRIVILSSSIGNILKPFGVADRVVGASDSIVNSKEDKAYSKVTNVGNWQKPDLETIIGLKPDAVFAYSNPAYLLPSGAGGAKEQMEKAGIKVILIDFNYESQVVSDMTAMGKLFGCEAKAQVYIDFYNKYKNLILTRLADVKDSDKPRVYYEGYTDYKSVNKNDGGHQLIVGAGGINIAANEGLGPDGTKTTPDFTSAEGHTWIINQNPDVIIKSISTTDKRYPFGASVTSTAAAKDIYDKLLTRDSNAWSSFDAATSSPKKVIVISGAIATNATGGIIGKLYIAKMLYPDKFSDINPYAIHTELMKNFFGQDLTGIYAYYES